MFQRRVFSRIVLGAGVCLAFALPFLRAAESGEGADTQQILTRYLSARRTQRDSLRGVEMQVKIVAKLPRLEKQGTLKALRRISKLGKITYKALGFSGDSTIKDEIIARYLSAESQSPETAITPVNYKFKYRGRANQDGRLVQIFQITPRKKRVGMFKGELWLDAETAMPVRESGRLVKTPSVFLKKVEFVNEYEIQNGVAIPKRFESKADVRIFGRAELNVDFSNFSRAETTDELTTSSNR
ncbi:MAG TPA: hypothetical protein VMB85_08200 [Bryobacteraceae bacterium]|nr:hypothetical protein [Bryobacteraceae bacterium]